MPRRRGGLRAGAPGQAYGNRTDLNSGVSLPARAATGQTYGLAQQQLQAQRTVPMAPPPQLPPGAPPAGLGGIPSAGTAPTSPAAPGMLPGAPPTPNMRAAAVSPGGFGPIDRPTERPGEPVTSGAPVGPGPGPEAIPQGPASPQNTNLSSMLAQISQNSGSPAIGRLATAAAAAGQ